MRPSYANNYVKLQTLGSRICTESQRGARTAALNVCARYRNMLTVNLSFDVMSAFG